MRTKRFLIGACVMVGILAIPSAAFGLEADQTIEAKLGTKDTYKGDKKKFKPARIFVETTTADKANPSGMPPKANNANIVFDKNNMKFDPNALPGCSNSQISGTTTEDAKATCGNSQVGAGDATAALPFGPGGARQDFPVVVTAFNNADDDGILLHSRVGNPLNTTTVLVGTLRGTVLNVVVPPLGGGVGAIAQFNTLVNSPESTAKAGSGKGATKYVQARCKKNKKIKTTSTFTFNDAPPATASDEQKCKAIQKN